jgi:hypothetical protein
MTIKQNTQEWLTEKQKYIGGSEIFALCLNYCKKELEQIGIKDETSFKTALEIYLEKKFDVKPDPINPVYSAFGLGMEEYIINRINEENKNFVATGSKDFIINSNVHKLAACSPDGFVEVEDDFVDYDKKRIEASKGVLEVKTVPFGFNFEAEAGAKWQYLFQVNYNALVCGNEWGMLACLTPKEQEFDNDFFKGKVLGILQGAEMNLSAAELAYKEHFKDLDSLQYYNLYTYTYKANKTIQNICKLALERFQKALDDIILPNLSDNKEKLMREKKMLAKMYPEKYGEINADQELSRLLDERGIINNQFKILETDLEETNCKIIQKMGKAKCAKSFNYVAKFDKRHALRVSQNKDSFVTQNMIDDLQEGKSKEFINYMMA